MKFTTQKALINKDTLNSILFLAFIFICFVLTLTAIQGDLLADVKGSGLFDGDSNEDSVFGGYKGYTKTISTLLIVIVLIITTVYVLKKKYGVSANFGRSRKLIQIVDHTPIGVKKSLFLVKVPGKHLILGVTNDNIGLITEIANEDIAVGVASTGDDSANKKEFLDIIKKSISEKRQK
ncbi:MAG: flagellar biosynthetic protein FliO [Candidatus Scalindua rubra]|uniref:Flagellar protein n=1 Tax=Candidatus Scalindua brodae TaxID=237368 RepID=A0A0B0EST6_9BACT|nr:MAG: Flagellar biosynthesis protein, FliO [Candidatus Scalindua brodae]MBZ0107219.1 flagellar biosynthetic protein FliO [Candidatus Scalindua rubra]TWU31658.1 Flagellar biosynthesis protein, FliO [Candidatus Brocadiaceae bacterium S225]